MPVLGWILGLGLFGAGLYLFRPVPAIVLVPRSTQELNGRAQDLLTFFSRNRGIALNTQNPEQNKLIESFQSIWNHTHQIPTLRTDGVWDSATANVFRQLTGYSPPPIQTQVTSGYLPLG